MTHRVNRPRRGLATPLAVLSATLATSALSLGAAMLAPSTASAGTIGVVQCGDVNPFWNTNPAQYRVGVFPFRDGSAGFQQGGNAGPGAKYTVCDGKTDIGYGTSISATLSPLYSQSTGSGATQTWYTPADTYIKWFGTAFRWVVRDFDGTSGTSGEVSISHSGQTDPDYDFRAQRPGPAGQAQSERTTIWVTPPGGATWIRFNAGCDGVSAGRYCPAGGNNNISQILVHGLLVSVGDDYAPQVSRATGELADQRYLKGTMGLSVGATDRGTGVADVSLEERTDDGKWTVRASKVIDSNGGKCAPLDGWTAGNVGSAGTTYTSPIPCRLSAAGDLELNTDTLPEGTRTIRVLVKDATGNPTTAVAQRSVIVDRTAPTVSYDKTADKCVEGKRLLVQPTVTDATSGVESIETSVTDTNGAKVPVAADGTIECGLAATSPLTVSAVATDKAGNKTTLARPKTITVEAAPVVLPETPVPGKDQVGDGGTNNPKPDSTPNLTPPYVAPAPPRGVNRFAAAQKMLSCSNASLLLTEAFPSGKNDVVSGTADPRFVNQRVTITYGPSGKYVTSAVVSLAGTFRAVVRAPKGKGATGNKARYQAAIGAVRSAPLKRTRRMYTTQTYTSGGGTLAVILGRVSGPFKKGMKLTVQRRGTACTRWDTVRPLEANKTGKISVDARGNFRASVKVEPGTDAVVLRVLGSPLKGRKSKRTIDSRTMPAPVQVQAG